MGRYRSLAKSYRRWSPYHYAMNNPIRFIDADGMGSYDENGKWVRESDEFNRFFTDPWRRTNNSLTTGDTGGNGGGNNVTMGDLLDAYFDSQKDKDDGADFSKIDFSQFGIKAFGPNDIIFLFDSEAVGGLGHAAVIIGNEKDGWYYYSLNGTGGDKGRAYGDALGADVGTKLGNISMSEAIKKANIINPNYVHNYDKTIALFTTTKEDQILKTEAAKAAGVEKYILTNQDCLSVSMAVFNKLLKMRGGLGPQTAKVPNSWGFFLPMSIWSYNVYLPSNNELKIRKK